MQRIAQDTAPGGTAKQQLQMDNGMGQIFRRMKRIADSYLRDVGGRSGHNLLDEEERRLREAIDALNDDSEGGPDPAAEARERARREQEARRRAAAAANGMTPERALAILELGPHASVEDIKAAYRRLMKKYHPDRVAALAGDVQELAQRKSRQINQAYQYLEKYKGF